MNKIYYAAAETNLTGFFIVVFTILIVVIPIYIQARNYKRSGFKEKTGKSYTKVRNDKGAIGEYKLYLELISIFGKNNVFPNLYIPKHNSAGYSELDLVAISNRGFFVFEMKNLSGHIYGNETQQQWTQVFHKNAKYKFYNPFLQNKTHADVLQKYLNVKENEIFPIIVFGTDANLQKVTYSSSWQLLKINDIRSHFFAFNKIARLLPYSENKLVQFREKLEGCLLVSENIKQAHISSVNKQKDRN